MTVHVDPVECIHCRSTSVAITISSKGLQAQIKCGCVYSQDDKTKLILSLREQVANVFGLEMPEEEDEDDSRIITP